LLGNKGARTLLRVEDAADFHFAISTHHGVGVDFEVDGDLTDGGQLVAGDKDLHRNGGLDLVDELAVEGTPLRISSRKAKGTPDWSRVFIQTNNVLVY
jgi:hypothetical protein